MVQVALGLGSNTDPADNIASCLDALLLQFNDLGLSSVFSSKALDEDATTYLNLVITLETALAVGELVAWLKALEAKLGRTPALSARGIIPIDIDLLLYGERRGRVDGIHLPSADILDKAYVLWPLSQVLPRGKHPGTGQRFAPLWQAFDGPMQDIRPVDFTWHGRPISAGG